MNADTLEYIAEAIRKIDDGTRGLDMRGVVQVYEEDGEGNDVKIGRLIFGGEVETIFEAG